MKKFLAVLVMSMGVAMGQSPTPLTATQIQAIQAAVAQAMQPPVTPVKVVAPATPTAPIIALPYLPQTIITTGVGGTVPGNGRFMYESSSSYLGKNTYMTQANEITIIGGKLQVCSLAGVTNVMYQFNQFSVGATGLVGGCVAPSTGTGSAATNEQFFLSYRIKKSDFSLIASGMKTFTSSGSTAAKATFGVQFSH